MGGSSSGASMQAGGYRQSAQMVMQAAAYNIGVVNVNLARNLNDISRAIPRSVGTQKAQASGSGFDVGSKSFQSIYSETLTVLERKAIHTKEDAEMQRQKIWFEAQSQAYSLEMQARTAEYQGKVQSRQQSAGMFSSVISGIGKLF